MRSHKPGTILSRDIKIMMQKAIMLSKETNIVIFRYFDKYHRDFCSTAVKHYSIAFWQTEQTVFFVYLRILVSCIDIVKYYLDKARAPVSRGGYTQIVYKCRWDSSVSAKQLPWEENCPRFRKTKFDVLVGVSGYPHKKHNISLLSNK